MPTPKTTNKNRVKGVQIYRPFVYGSIAKPFDPATRPADINQDHTHQWTIYVRPASPTADLTHWLKKVQFKLHETYANSSRMVESPPFEVTESGWGEFEVQIKLFFVPEANEKAQTLWHALKLHPFGEGAEGVRERRESVVSQCYEEVLFSEPVEPFYEILTQGAQGGRGGKGGGGKGSKQVAVRKGGERSAEIQARPSEGFPYSEKTEGEEIDRLRGAIKEVERLVEVEEGKLEWKEAEMEGLRRKGMV